MKNRLIILPMMALLFSSCGMDSDTPSSLLNGGAGDIAPINAGSGTVRVKPASFGMYDSFINPHPEERRTSLYRLFVKQGRNYIYQENGAEELKLNTTVDDVAVQLVLYKERISSSTVGDFQYYEMVDGEYQLVETTNNEFRAIQQGDDASTAQLIFTMKRTSEEGSDDVEFKLTLHGENLVYSQMIEDENQQMQEVTSDVTVEKINVNEVVEYGSYINDVMMEKSSCKRVTAGNIVGITNYTTDAARSLEYRKCYWDLYDRVVRDFVKAHKDAVAAGDARGEKCMGAVFTAIKKELKQGKTECQNQFGN
jgi:hypothetical protein